MLDISSAAKIPAWIRLLTPPVGVGVGLLLTYRIWAFHPTTAEVGIIVAAVVLCLHAIVGRYLRS